MNLLHTIRYVFTAYSWPGRILSEGSHYESNDDIYDYVFSIDTSPCAESGHTDGRGVPLLRHCDQHGNTGVVLVALKFSPSRQWWREVKRREKGLWI